MKNRCRLALGLPLIVISLTVLCQTAPADVSGMFQDHMVLQRGIKVPVYGESKKRGTDGTKVVVKFNGQTKTTTIKDNKWQVELDAMEAGGPFTMEVDGKTIKDIYVGDVWLLSGQSNMKFSMEEADDGKKDIASGNEPMIRLNKFGTARSGGGWFKCSPESVKDFSAVGYYFAQYLREKEPDVAVGLVGRYVGNTAISRWLVKGGGCYKRYTAGAIKYGYRGICWYQGEADNRGDASRLYKNRMIELIEGWREENGRNDLPFLFVQMQRLGNPTTAFLREQQLQAWQETENTGMAVIYDTYPVNLHPLLKQTVGERLGVLARGIVYGDEITFSGPIYSSMEKRGSAIALNFDHVGDGLKIGGEDKELAGFYLCGEDQKFVKATAKIEGNEVVVTSNEIATPVAVRYGWQGNVDGNLYNTSELPASPFRTDTFEDISLTPTSRNDLVSKKKGKGTGQK